MDDWLRRMLVERGYLDAATGATRNARMARCPSCDAWVLRGLDADWCAMSVDADPKALSALGEALVLMAGGRSVEVRELTGRAQLDSRNRWRIQERPAGGSWSGDVLAAHLCRRQLPGRAYGYSRLGRPGIEPPAAEPPF